MCRTGDRGERSGPTPEISALDDLAPGAGAESIPESIDGFRSATAARLERIDAICARGDHDPPAARSHAPASGAGARLHGGGTTRQAEGSATG